MGRGGSDTTSGSTIFANEDSCSLMPAISSRRAEGAYDQDDLIYFSGGHLPPRGLRFLSSGSAYISVHARLDGTFEVLRQIQRAKGRVVGLARLQLDLLYVGGDIAEAVAVAAAARKELAHTGLRQDGASNADLPALEALERTLHQLEDVRRASREHKGPAIVDASYVEHLREKGWPERHIELAERARDTNPTAVGRQTLPARRIR